MNNFGVSKKKNRSVTSAECCDLVLGLLKSSGILNNILESLFNDVPDLIGILTEEDDCTNSLTIKGTW